MTLAESGSRVSVGLQANALRFRIGLSVGQRYPVLSSTPPPPGGPQARQAVAGRGNAASRAPPGPRQAAPLARALAAAAPAEQGGGVVGGSGQPCSRPGLGCPAPRWPPAPPARRAAAPLEEGKEVTHRREPGGAGWRRPAARR